MDLKKLKDVLNESYKKYKDIKEGKNASYIPYLASVDSNFVEYQL